VADPQGERWLQSNVDIAPGHVDHDQAPPNRER
jgi:hypothetical protein